MKKIIVVLFLCISVFISSCDNEFVQSLSRPADCSLLATSGQVEENVAGMSSLCD